MPDINGIPYVESDDLVSAYPAASQALAQEVSDQLASKLVYPSGGSDGDLLAKDGTAAEWIAVPEAGLTLITTESFSAVSSVSLNGVFTSDYANYRLIFTGVGSVRAFVINWRVRAAGTDATGSNYSSAEVLRESGLFLSRDFSGTNGRIGTTETSAVRFSADIYSPQLSAITGLVSHETAVTVGTNIIMYLAGSVHDLTNSYDGLTIFPDSGTITGTIRVYGYKD
jgi:hypothetical protein